MRTRIKFCGINKQSDFAYAEALGADAIGLVFHEASPRYIAVDDAQILLQKATGLIKVIGLFMDASYEAIERVISRINIDYIQFHGAESAEFCASFAMPYVKAIPMGDEEQAKEMIEEHRNTADILLLDGHRVGTPGGQGVAFDWRNLSTIDVPLFVAGGLKPENVEQAIVQCHPQGVDVSSGVESTVGVKDHGKMKAFAEAVLRADYNKLS